LLRAIVGRALAHPPGDADSYRAAARSINLSNADCVNVQHEFGLYGVWKPQLDKNGEPDGEYTYDDHLSIFLQELKKAGRDHPAHGAAQAQRRHTKNHPLD